MEESQCLFLLLVNVLFISCNGIFYGQPEQVHLSYGRDPTQMILMWSTKNDTKESVVKYGLDRTKLLFSASGYQTLFVDPGPKHRTQYFHRVVMTELIPGKKYYYHCGSRYGWSAIFAFTSMPNSTDWSPRLVMFGDMGSVNAQSLPRLQREFNMYDAVLHVGDFAYDMDSNESLIGDIFMNEIQPIAANLPYMTCPGNHEQAGNFSNYRNRFTMPTDEHNDKMFYSFDMGPAHIISLNTEYYFYIQYGLSQILKQWEWLKEDLEKANLPENRAKRPWIITMGHRPMYCSNNDHDDCTRHESLVRVGIPFIEVGGLEHLYDKYGVDIALWAHEHSYERLWPVYNRKVYNGSAEYPYTNPPAPVHIITGSAGCKEDHDTFVNNTASWSAFRSMDYGYTRMTIHNHSHVSFQQVSDDQDGKVIDSFTIIKDKHEPYGRFTV